MKNILFLISFIFIFISCNSKVNRIENEFLNCFKDEDLVNDILEFESKLINQNILKDKSGESYILLLNRIKNNNDIRMIDFEFKRNIEITNEIADCQKKLINSNEFSKSKIFKIKDYNNKLISENNFSKVNVVDGFLKIIDINDFDLPYYKMSVFRLLNIFENERNFENRFSKTINYKDAITVYINEKNIINLNNKIITHAQLKSNIKKYYQKNKEKSTIILKTEKSTLHSKYLEVSNTISSALFAIRDSFSVKNYKVDYSKLDSDKKQIVDSIYPNNLIEIIAE